jgi:hypothetical protein
MPTIAFWNIKGISTPGTVAKFAHECRADVLVLAECEMSRKGVTISLNTDSPRLYFLDELATERITVFTTVRPNRKQMYVSDNRYCCVRHYNLPLFGSLLVVMVHLSSKVALDGRDQAALAPRLRETIEECEAKVGHTRTVVVGDFNMNPFEDGVIGSEGIHAVSDRRVAANVSRTVLFEERSYLYNPMWRFLGDQGPNPPGTFYYPGSAPITHHWNTFDQVLIRPALLPYFRDEGVGIVTSIGETSLVSEQGHPNRNVGSDHFPVYLQLSDEELNRNGQEPLG